jgi:uncharacterized membrane protein (DUF373 family)
VEIADSVVHYAVAVLLLVIAAVVLIHTVADFTRANDVFSAGVTAAVNGVLFVIIVLEILRTVVAHFDEGGFQLRPFLVIGIVSAVRHILTVGAQISLADEKSAAHLHDSLLELGVNAAVVVALAVALLLVRNEK